MEYAPGGDMFEYVLSHRVPGPGPTGLTEADARHFFQQLVCAVEFAHELGVANRDIKLENTLLDDSGVVAGTARLPDVKICDFGYSKNEFVDSRPKSVSGTPDYIAPEVRMKRENGREKQNKMKNGMDGMEVVVRAVLSPSLSINLSHSNPTK
jgi:serine/threonine-protein kinase SRK2